MTRPDESVVHGSKARPKDLPSVDRLLRAPSIAALALGVSARASSSRSALTVLLAFWFLNCLVAPRAAGDLAEAAHQTPTPVQFQRSMQADLDGQGIQVLGRLVVVSRDDLVARAVVAQRFAERDVHIDR